MKTNTFPKIENVAPLARKGLLVQFDNGESRIYDCRPLLKKSPFIVLQNDSFFRMVKVDAGGYGGSWSDDVDLSESELWKKGQEPNKALEHYAAKRVAGTGSGSSWPCFRQPPSPGEG